MGKTRVKAVVHERWGNCVELSNGTVDLLATVDFGPRIIRYGFTGGANVFFEDREEAITQQGESFAAVGGGAWKIYGGHRLWTSPEEVPRTTYPDNAKVAWRETEDGIILTPDEEVWNQVQKEIEISLASEGTAVRVIHRITNNGPWTAEFAPWALSVMAPGGAAVVPQTQRQTGLLANRTISLWSYTKMNDQRVVWGDKYILLRQDPAVDSAFKIGTTNEPGWAAYANGGNLFVKRYNHVRDGFYPDFGVSFETYTNDKFLELETLGELRKVAPGETAAHEETWTLASGYELPGGSEEELEASLRPIMG